MLRGGNKARKLHNHNSMAISGFPYGPKIGQGYIGERHLHRLHSCLPALAGVAVCIRSRRAPHKMQNPAVNERGLQIVGQIGGSAYDPLDAVLNPAV